MNETLLGRCLSCWEAVWAAVDVNRAYPQTFAVICPKCKGLRTFAITARLQPLRRAGALQHLKTSTKNHVQPLWDQLALPEPMLPTGSGLPLSAADERREQANDHTPTPAEMRIRNGSGSTRPRQNPAE